MTYYKNTTQTPNVLFDTLLKNLNQSQLKVLLTVIRKTIGQIDPSNKAQRLDRAWISQKLFMICCNLSGRAVSNAIDWLVNNQLVEVTTKEGIILNTKEKRRGKIRLYYQSRLRLENNYSKASEQILDNPVNNLHIIKLNTNKQSCYNSSQGLRVLSDSERLIQLLKEKDNRNTT